MYFDGTVNVHGNGIWAILISPAGAHYPVVITLRFPRTNVAVYEACIVSFEAALDMNVKGLEVYGDTILIISQSTIGSKKPWIGQAQRKFNQNPWGLPFSIFQLSVAFKEGICWCFANLSSKIKISEETDLRHMMVETYDRPIYCHNVKIDPDGNTWYLISKHS